MDKQKVWIPDVQKGFLLGRIVDLGSGKKKYQLK